MGPAVHRRLALAPATQAVNGEGAERDGGVVPPPSSSVSGGVGFPNRCVGFLGKEKAIQVPWEMLTPRAGDATRVMLRVVAMGKSTLRAQASPRSPSSGLYKAGASEGREKKKKKKRKIQLFGHSSPSYDAGGSCPAEPEASRSEALERSGCAGGARLPSDHSSRMILGS